MLQAVAEFRVDALRERVKERLARTKLDINTAEFHDKGPLEEQYELYVASSAPNDPCYWSGFTGWLKLRAHRCECVLKMLDLTTDDTIQLDTDVVLNVLLGE